MISRTTQHWVRAGVAGLFLSGLAALSGCNNAGEGLLAGGGLGAGAGAILGSLSGHAGTGAAIGAVVGGLGGAIVGDQNERNSYRPPPGYGYPAYGYPVYATPPGYYEYREYGYPRRVYVYERNTYERGW